MRSRSHHSLMDIIVGVHGQWDNALKIARARPKIEFFSQDLVSVQRPTIRIWTKFSHIVRHNARNMLRVEIKIKCNLLKIVCDIIKIDSISWCCTSRIGHCSFRWYDMYFQYNLYVLIVSLYRHCCHTLIESNNKIIYLKIRRPQFDSVHIPRESQKLIFPI